MNIRGVELTGFTVSDLNTPAPLIKPEINEGRISCG